MYNKKDNRSTIAITIGKNQIPISGLPRSWKNVPVMNCQEKAMKKPWILKIFEKVMKKNNDFSFLWASTCIHVCTNISIMTYSSHVWWIFSSGLSAEVVYNYFLIIPVWWWNIWATSLTHFVFCINILFDIQRHMGNISPSICGWTGWLKGERGWRPYQ